MVQQCFLCALSVFGGIIRTCDVCTNTYTITEFKRDIEASVISVTDHKPRTVVQYFRTR
jgi:hypothetical protein